MIYLDNAATAPMRPEVFEAMQPWMCPARVGNPSSIHRMGHAAKMGIEKGREAVAKLINADPDQIIFTSGGTEANNMALRPKGLDYYLMASAAEHHSVLECRWMYDSEYEELRCDSSGKVDINALHKSLVDIDEDRHHHYVTVSTMLVNNEVGCINDIEAICDVCHEYDYVRLHVDAVQGAGHVPIDVKKIPVDYLSLSSHKLGGPMGVGALYVRNMDEQWPFMLGGGQEHGKRSGTENVAGIIGFGEAAILAKEEAEAGDANAVSMRTAFQDRLSVVLDHRRYVQNSSAGGVSNILNYSFPGINSEELVMLLDMKDLCCSTGSACTAQSAEPSHVLQAMGLSYDRAASAIRLSFGWNNTVSEAVEAANIIASVVMGCGDD